MSQSVYIRLAFWLVNAELKREEKAWKKKVRQQYAEIPYQSQHMLKDIGMNYEGVAAIPSESRENMAKRRMRTLKRLATLQCSH
ncbi:hypothetical protein HC752_14420 [Vibrio sp. S9_S30]|uniref:hypothetical protein n=1 Tax=Vibrio sp. S9_S30 TaxID=2720226 RepID=UPI0016810D27|nr:hypothetical protein [Vibrio sp. S9_S30]MBD1558131.1 hypothetical protein [Vibrio sp. S9_S30]